MSRKVITALLTIYFSIFINYSHVRAQTLVNMNDDLYYTESGAVLTNSGLNLRSSNGGFNFTQTGHPLMNDGILFPVVDYLGRNLWLKVTHMENANYPQSQFSPWGGSSGSYHLFGGWDGFFYQFDIYKDSNLTGSRLNILNGLFNTSIRLTSEETLSNGEILDFNIINNNLTTAYWLLESINFTGNLPQSRPIWSTSTGGASTIFPEGNKFIHVSSTPDIWSEFKLSANTISQFTYGYEYSTVGFNGYQGITLTVGIEPTITICDPASEAPLSVTTDDADNNLCEGASITLSANDAVLTPGAIYQWYEGGCGVGNLLGTSSTLTLSPSAGVHQYYVRIKDNCGNYTTCTASPAVTVTAVPSVSINVVFSTGVCVASSQYQFYATGINGGSNPVYQWQKNGLDISGETQNSYVTSSLAEGDQIACTFRKADNYCGTALSNIITMADLTPTINITSNASGTICAGTNVTFTANTTNAGTTPTYQWKLNGNNVGGNAATYSNATLLNNDVVSCSINNGCKSANSNSLTMSVNQVPTSVSIAFTNPVVTICEGDYISFTATPTGMGTNFSIDRFYWKKNGVTVKVGLYFDNQYTASNLVNDDVITCEMVSSMACTLPVTSNSITVTVNPTSTVSIALTSGSNPDCSGEPLTFTAIPVNGGSNISYEWHLTPWFPAIDHVVGTNSPTFTLQNPTNNDIVRCDIIVYDVCSSPVTVSSNSITVKAPTILSGYINCNSNCDGSANVSTCGAATIQFSAISWNVINSFYTTNNSPSYQWKLNGNDVGTNSITYSQTGFTDGDVITCDVVSTEPCSTPASLTLSMTVSVYDVSSATLTVSGPADICSGVGVGYSASATNAGLNPTYQWKKNGNDIVGETGSSYTANGLMVGDVISCVLTTDPVCASPITVNGNSITITSITPTVVPTISIAASNPLTYMSNTFTASITNGGNNPGFTWYKNGNYVFYGNPYQDAALAVGDVIICNLYSDAPCANPSSVNSNELVVIPEPAYCIPTSGASYNACEYSWITNVQLGTSLNKTTGCDGLYSDFTATDTLKAVAGETISYNLLGGSNGSNWYQRRAIYIDFNGDKDFEDAGEKVVDVGDGALNNSIGTFTLPQPLGKGSYRIRVVADFDVNFSPCNVDGGEAEDYILQITYCTPQSPYQQPACQYYYTSNVTLGNSINNNTGCGGFYSDFSPVQILSASASETINFSVSLGNIGGQNFGSSVYIFIDYNNDGDFNDAGEKVVDNIYLSEGNPATGTFILPALIAFGSYRIRVVNSAANSSPCDIDYGEVEDYTLLIPQPVYCIPVISNPCDVWISNVTIGSINHSTMQPVNCNAGGYTDYSGVISTTNAPGQTVNYALSAMGNYYQYADIYVDYNLDGDFDDVDELVAGNIFLDYSGTPVAGSFIIPATQAYGYYRMRVKSYASNELQSGACGNNINGEIEDYQLVIQSGQQPVTFQLTAYLEGFYSDVNTMRANIYDLGISTDPTETDTVRVNLWSPASLSNPEPDYSILAVLHTDGTASMQFPQAVTGNEFYIAVKHRNHMETWSKLPVMFTSITSYDFSNALAQAYDDGVNPPMASVAGSKFAFYGGDVNKDGTIDASDMADVDNDNAAFAFGYNDTDVSGDGATDASDISIVDNNQALFLFYARPY